MWLEWLNITVSGLLPLIQGKKKKLWQRMSLHWAQRSEGGADIKAGQLDRCVIL